MCRCGHHPKRASTIHRIGVLLGTVGLVVLLPTSGSAQPRASIQKNRLPVAVQKKLEQGLVKATLPSGAVHEVSSPVEAVTVQVPVGAIVVARGDSVARPASSSIQKAVLDRARLAGIRLGPTAGGGAGGSGGAGAAGVEAAPSGGRVDDDDDATVVDVPIDIVAPQGTSGAVRAWRPYVIHPSRLGYDSQRDQFTGQVLIGLRSPNGDGSVVPLSAAVGISLVTDATVSPDQLTFAAGSVNAARVAVSTANAADSVALHLHANGLDAGEQVRVSLALPTVLRFENPPPRLQAFGSEPRWVTIGTYGATLTRPVRVRISGGAARVEPDTATIEPGGSVRVKVIAEEVGPFKLSATGAGVIGTSVSLNAVWPIRFALSIVLGGLAGALFADMRGARRRTGKTRKYTYAVLGALLSVTAWVSLGVNLTQVPIGNALLSTLGVFAFAFIGAAFGVWVDGKQGGVGTKAPTTTPDAVG
ncbi:MAG TPA: hypothetical protein VGE27_01190 [Gemmatimonas sp.]|uniref:hypothetical protein n=1 Tax=Gemmatimonas sp. TaxID=1962908 RepID=UPI002EDAEBF5